jgi:hypothetical protein
VRHGRKLFQIRQRRNRKDTYLILKQPEQTFCEQMHTVEDSGYAEVSYEKNIRLYPAAKSVHQSLNPAACTEACMPSSMNRLYLDAADPALHYGSCE